MRPALFLPFLAFATPLAQAQYNVFIEGEVRPGVYGRLRIGDAPPPPVVYARPVVIVREPRPLLIHREPRVAEAARPVAPPAAQPVYLHVPPGHAKDWKKHCRKYDACAQPVYFVRSAEYEKPKKAKKLKKDKD